jgi:hypothetical protein
VDGNRYANTCYNLIPGDRIEVAKDWNDYTWTITGRLAE